MKSPAPLWKCPNCQRRFANRNQTHTCGLHDIEHHFRHGTPEPRAIFERFVCELEKIGPVTILPEKTRIAFQVRMSFAQLTPRRRWVDGHLVLAERHEDPRFRKVETFSPRNHLHAFRLATPADIDEVFIGLMRLAYAVGEQRHLAS